MRITWMAPVLGVTAMAVFLAIAGNALREASDPATASIVEPAATPPSAALKGDRPGTDAAPHPVKARPVGAAVVVPPPIEADDLERVEPRGPLSDLALALPPKTGVPERTLLYRPVATAAGRLEAQGHSIALEGILPVEPEETCRAADGSFWPCGMVARTAFRNWLRGRAVDCIVAEPAVEETVVTECSLGEKDVALWLVENGFVQARPGGRYAEVGERARTEARGIFGPGPAR